MAADASGRSRACRRGSAAPTSTLAALLRQQAGRGRAGDHPGCSCWSRLRRRCWRPIRLSSAICSDDAAAAAERGALARHRRSGPRYPFAHHLRLAAHALRRRPGRDHRGPDRPAGRHGRRLCRRLDRCGPDAHHRHLPRLPEAHPGAGLRRRARARHRERGHRHRHHLLAALRPHRARRDADHPQLRLHRGGRG